jgi:hypothetical protein
MVRNKPYGSAASTLREWREISVSARGGTQAAPLLLVQLYLTILFAAAATAELTYWYLSLPL